MNTPRDDNDITRTVQENLKQAILVQARLIAELRKEVDKLKAPSHRANRTSTTKRSHNTPVRH